MKQYAYIGCWGRISPDNPLGISAFEYEDGNFKLLETYDTDARIGSIEISGDNLYVTDEAKEYKGAPCGGGRFFTYKISEDGRLNKASWEKSFGVFPCYVSLSLDKKYAVIVNHSNNRGVATKTAFVDGDYRVVLDRNESNVVLFRLKEDGCIDKAVDIINLTDFNGEKHPMSMPHSVRRMKDKDIFFVIENGDDRIYRFKLNESSEKLELLNDTFCAEKNSYPRYSAMSPDGQYLYVDDEKRPFVNTFKIDQTDGKLELLQSIRMIPEDQPLVQEKIVAPAAISPSDIIIDEKGQNIYTACRGTNTITVFAVGADNLLSVKQVIDCGGNYPRSLQFDPEEKYLFCCNMDANIISVFAKQPDGTIVKHKDIEYHAPGVIKFIK